MTIETPATNVTTLIAPPGDNDTDRIRRFGRDPVSIARGHRDVLNESPLILNARDTDGLEMKRGNDASVHIGIA
jgi:hypothetical protein